MGKGKACHPNAFSATAVPKRDVARLCHEALHNLMHDAVSWNKTGKFLHIGLSRCQDAPCEIGSLHTMHVCTVTYYQLPRQIVTDRDSAVACHRRPCPLRQWVRPQSFRKRAGLLLRVSFWAQGECVCGIDVRSPLTCIGIQLKHNSLRSFARDYFAFWTLHHVEITFMIIAQTIGSVQYMYVKLATPRDHHPNNASGRLTFPQTWIRERNKPIQNRLGTEFDESSSSLHLLILQARCLSNYICSKHEKKREKTYSVGPVSSHSRSVSINKTIWGDRPLFIQCAGKNTLDSCFSQTLVLMHRLRANHRCLCPITVRITFHVCRLDVRADTSHTTVYNTAVLHQKGEQFSIRRTFWFHYYEHNCECQRQVQTLYFYYILD